MDTVPGIDAARLATVQVYDCGAQPGKEHRGQGLLLDLDGQQTVVLTCHHVIAPVAKENLCVRIREANDQLSDPISVQYDEQRSQAGKDAVVLHVDRARVSARPRPLLHALNPKTYAESLLATGLTYMKPESFDAHVGASTRLEIPVDVPGNWPDPPTHYILPVAYRLVNPTDARPGISGGVVLCENGVLGLVHFSRGAAADWQREAYLVPLSVWAERLPELAELIEPLIYEMTGRGWNIRLTSVSQLRLKSFKLGDTTAATFPYVITPIQETYSNAIQAISDACEKTGSIKRGILVLGESNAGKTRLAIEVLRKTLPDWFILRWRPDFTIDNVPPIQYLRGRHLVLFIDDLQDYVAAQGAFDPRVAALRSLWELLIQLMQHLVIVGTCRSEDSIQVQAKLNWLFIQLTRIVVPSFNKDDQDLQAASIIAEFQKRGSVHPEDWDGTIGSLVLGLSTKNSQYLALINDHKPAATVLKAMKLLSNAFITEHTEPRIRLICSDVFGETKLRKSEKVWREAVEELTLLQFITVEYDDPEITLVIRKDTYFEKVITDYPLYNQPKRVERDFTRLFKVFIELKDADALSNLGIKLALLNRTTEAIEAVNHALTLKSASTSEWYNKAMVFSLIGKDKEAQTSFDHALTLYSTLAFDRFTEQARKALGLAQEEAQRFEHNYIGTEHLLLGLIREGEGTAAKVLSSFGIELDITRTAVGFIIGRGDGHIVLEEIGLTPNAKKALDLAIDEARRLKHDYVGTEHLLLGLIRLGRGIATGIIEAWAASLEEVRRQTFQVLGLDENPFLKIADLHELGAASVTWPIPRLKGTFNTTLTSDKFTNHAKKVLSLAQEEAQRFEHNYIGTEHLLLGLIREGEGTAAKVLSNLGIDLNKVRSAVEFIIGRGDRIILGKIGLTPRARRVIELAIDEAHRMRHNYVGTEHVLLGLMREGQGIAAGVLESLGTNLEEVRRQTFQILGLDNYPQEIEELQLKIPLLKVPQLKDAIETLVSILLEKHQALQQQNYELSSQLEQREAELRSRIDILESLEIYLHHRSNNERFPSGERNVP